MSTATRLADPLVESFSSGVRVAAEGKVRVVGIGTVQAGRRDRRQLAVLIDTRLFPWPPPA
jgi:hypothetical protein